MVDGISGPLLKQFESDISSMGETGELMGVVYVGHKFLKWVNANISYIEPFLLITIL